ncbi:MAG TPA: hypothetical protein VFJ82_24955 [Longimicrobium sp.]|nr:hypothetical protein [Longimicrobium sp.]
MSAEANSLDRSTPRREGVSLARLAGQVRSLLRRFGGGGEPFTTRIEAKFRPWIEITHPEAGRWFATLEALSPDKHQADALVRLSRAVPAAAHAPQRTIPEDEERDRVLFATPVPAAPSTDDDLVLAYSFPMFLSEEHNVRLFEEFARNELGRLRAPGSSRPTRTTSHAAER